MNVVLMAATPGAKAPVRLGSARSGRGGEFTLRYAGAADAAVKYLLATRPGGAAEAGFPVPGQTYRLAPALGEGAVPRQVKVTERTTVAMGFAMAQFIGAGDEVAGKNPGLRNAAAMSGDLVNLGGGLNRVMRRIPQRHLDLHPRHLQLARQPGDGSVAGRTSAAPASSPRRGPPAAPRAADTLAAVVNIARNPWHDVGGLFRLALGGQVGAATGGPSLGARRSAGRLDPGAALRRRTEDARRPRQLRDRRRRQPLGRQQLRLQPAVAAARLRQQSAFPLHPHRADLPRLAV